MDTPYRQNLNNVISPKVEVDPSFNPFRNQAKASPRNNISNLEGLYLGLESRSNSDFNPIVESQFESDALQSSIFEKESFESDQNTFQLHNKYIVGTIKSGLVVIDQNRAHERILYEDYLEQITLKEPVSQQLLFPLRLEFSTQELAVVKNIEPQLVQAGFKFSAFESDALELTALPVGVQETFVSKIFDQLISDAQNEVPDFNFSQSDLLAKSIAKSLATKNGKKIKYTRTRIYYQRAFCM
jgi:DNA mismatch repair protein MutL